MCSTEVTTREEYIMETNIITIIPIYNNYQDIRTFSTIRAEQTYRFSVPSGAWAAEIGVTKCSLRGTEPGVTSCPVQIITSTHSIPQRVTSSGEQVQQFGVR